MKCVFKAKVGWGKAATTKTMQHGEKVADLVLRRGFGAAGSNADKPLLQIGATTRAPQRVPELSYKIIAGEQIKFGNVAWESLYQCSLGDL